MNNLHKYITQKYKMLRHVLMINCLTDKQFMSIKYKQVFGRKLDWNNPKTLNEKLQWLKLNDRNDIYTDIVGKFTAKKYIADVVGQKYVVPNYGVWDSFDDIDFDSLPERFVLKTTTGGGGAGVVLCKNKSSFDKKQAKDKLTTVLHTDVYKSTREWPYKNVKPQIIAEKLLETKEGKIPNDYKLHFINGEFQFVYVSFDREGVNDRCLYDKEWKRMPFVWVEKCNYRPSMNTSDVPKPCTFEEMLSVGKKIASIFKYVRVDFYDIDGVLLIGEITLYHGSGFDQFFPEKYDSYYGNLLSL